MKKTILGIIWVIFWVLLFMAPLVFGQDSTHTKQLDSLINKHWGNISSAQKKLTDLEVEKNKIFGYLQAEAVIIEQLKELRNKSKINTQNIRGEK